MGDFIKQKEQELMDNASSPGIYSPETRGTMASNAKKHNFESPPKPGAARKQVQKTNTDSEPINLVTKDSRNAY